jgi:hypothetical protein
MCAGKSAKLRDYKSISTKAFPVYYKNQRSAWMDAHLFKTCFFEEFVPKVAKFKKKSFSVGNHRKLFY